MFGGTGLHLGFRPLCVAVELCGEGWNQRWRRLLFWIKRGGLG